MFYEDISFAKYIVNSKPKIVHWFQSVGIYLGESCEY